MKTNIQLYSTAAELLADCDKDAHRSWQPSQRTSRKIDHRGWAGTQDYPEAKNLALYGWEKGLKDINTKLSFTRGGVIPHRAKDVAGHSPDVARFIAGLPDCMNRKVISHSNRKPCLDIVFNGSFPGRISADLIMNYGAAVANVIDSLEHSGYSVSLKVGAVGILSNDVAAGYLLDLKQHGEHMDIGKLAYFIAHPSALRRIAFAQIEIYNDKRYCSGYGTPQDVPQEMRGDLYFGKQLHLDQCYEIEGAQQFVNNIVATQQPELLEAA